MNIWQHLIEALESLASNKLRSGLTILGIVIGVASVISMLAIGQGAQSSVESQITSMGTNLLFVSSGGQGASNPKPLTMSDVNALLNPDAAPSIVAAAPQLTARIEMTVGGATSNTTVTATTANFAEMRNLTLYDGEFITDAHNSSRAAVVVLGSEVATTLFNSMDGVVGQTIRLSGQPFKVIGVLQSKGGGGLGSQDNQAYVPLTTAQARLIRRPQRTRVDQIVIQVANSNSVDAAIEEATNVLRTEHKTKIGSDDFNILSQQEILNTASSITGVLTLFLGGVGAISLLVGGIGIMNIMLVSVSERTREIGLRKAIGARKGAIRLQFLLESSLLSIMGGLIGVAVAWGITSIIKNLAASSNTLINPIIDVQSVMLATLFSAAVGLFFGFYPANRAANLAPAEALRSE